MKLSQNNLTEIGSIINPLLGQIARNVKLGIGSFITMKFGYPPPISPKSGLGEWFLWIYYCGWYLENPDGLFIGSEDPRKILKQQLSILEGRKLENVDISPIGLETNFIFESKLVLHTFPLNFIEPCEYWMLFTPKDKVLVLGSKPTWSYEEASEPRHY